MAGGTDAKHFSRLGIGLRSPARAAAGYDSHAMFHGVDERIPVTALHFGVRVMDRLLTTRADPMTQVARLRAWASPITATDVASEAPGRLAWLGPEIWWTDRGRTKEAGHSHEAPGRAPQPRPRPRPSRMCPRLVRRSR